MGTALDYEASTSAATLSEVERAMRALVEGVPPVLRPDVVRTRGWVCIATEDELVGSAAKTLARACRVAGYQRGWALGLSWNQSQPRQSPQEMVFDARGLEYIRNVTFLGSCYVLIGSGCEFAVATDGDMYWMLAGPKSFVETAIDADIESRMADFDATVARYARNPTSVVAQRFLTISRSRVAATSTHINIRTKPDA